MEKINAYALKQQSLGEEIKTILEKSKKDGNAKKTESYVNKRLGKLNENWTEVQKNNAVMESLKIPEHNYWTTDYYGQIQDVYIEAKKYLTSFLKPEGDDESEESEDFQQQSRIKRQEIRGNQLRKTLAKVTNDLQEEKPKAHYENLSTKLQNQWSAFEQLNEDILVEETDFSHAYFTNEVYNVLEKQFDTIMTELQDRCQKIQVTQVGHENKVAVNLPQVKLPTFQGGYENWVNFQDLFSKLIDKNASLSLPEKMQYLKTHVGGEAAKLIQHLSTVGANYETAYQLLRGRYENTRLILSKLIDKLLDQPATQMENAEKLKQLYDTTTECLQAITNLGVSTAEWGPIVGRIIVRKWDNETNKLYELSLDDPHEVQELDTTMRFMEKRFQALESLSSIQTNLRYNNPTSNKQRCSFCQLDHWILNCKKFRELSKRARLNSVNDKRLCLNCLTHDVREKCHSQRRCQICDGRHHTMIHQDAPKYNPPSSRYPSKPRSMEKTTPNTSSNTNHSSSTDKSVLLATAWVNATTNLGTSHTLRALMDQGSQSSFITENAAQTLGLPKIPIKAEITGLGDGSPKLAKWKVCAILKPRFPSNCTFATDLIVLPQLTHSLPKTTLTALSQDLGDNTILADPTYNRSGPIDIILGAHDLGQVLLTGVKKLGNGLIAQDTELGWILSGRLSGPIPHKVEVTSMLSQVEEDKQLTKFWEMEEVNTNETISDEDKHCEKHFQLNTKRDGNGNYVVRIPFTENGPQLGNSKNRATARLLQLEKRLERNDTLRKDYNDFMQEYLALGHMREVPKNEYNAGKYYIPHQPVIREDSLTTKLRVVFDASCKTNSNVSLNDTMHVGPKLQQDLSQILLRWRKHRYVMSADIEKMYRAIKMHPDDQQFQRILWRFDSNHQIREYELTTVTYGTKAAPFLAIRTLKQLAEDVEKNYPLAAKIINDDFYVDDVLTGANTIEEAEEIQRELLQVMESAGFNLRKWSGNSRTILERLPQNLVTHSLIDMVQDEPKKSLGVLWKPTEDIFLFEVKTNACKKVTKRTILSNIATLFDPLGFLSPIIITAKLLMQELWRKQVPWDHQVDEKTAEQWRIFEDELKTVENITIQRWCYYEKQQLQIHGFCDASEKAYGAAVYSRVVINNETKMTLLMAKSKVTPIKQKVTLPKLELCAAVLLSKLIDKTIQALNIQNVEIFAWSDSMITLGWIRGEPSRFKTFVANRVTQIRANVHQGRWNYVSTKENPADMISRGIKPSKLKDNLLWWEGPQWLQKSEEEWPLNENVPESNTEIITTLHTTLNVKHESILQRFSSLQKMLRVLAYCLRFINIVRKQTTEKGKIKVKELDNARSLAVKLTQNVHFYEECKQLRAHRPLNSKSRLLTLNPLLDENHIIRVGGRLNNSELTFGSAHPIILPSDCHLTLLIIRDAHHITLHGGATLTLAYIRKHFWILNGKNGIKSVIHKCITCTRHKAQAQTQLMGQLPTARVTMSGPFSHTGVDYAGPVQLRCSKGRGIKCYKGWIAIFVCLATRAVHIEVVSDMTSETFLAAFKRFTSRRGRCAHMYSDNGTTFVGAAKALHKEITNIIRNTEDVLANRGTQWRFIPPSSPHQGGLWEAAVKSLKYHLRRILGGTTLTYEEMTTVTQQIEACLNSRPICVINDKSEYLTPAHFLTGRELLTAPTEEVNTPGTMTQRWQYAQKLNKHIWQAWSKHYLLNLQQRYKWKHTENNLELGNIVLIKDDNLGPNQWPMAKIVDVHQGKDNLTRVVTVQKSDRSQVKRPIQKLILLPTSDELKTTLPETSKQKTERQRETEVQSTTNKPSKRSHISLLIMTMCIFFVQTAKAGYILSVPHPGLYIEHFGQTRTECGIFRIQAPYPLHQEEANVVDNIIYQFSDLCNQTRDLSKETHCDLLTQHLEDQRTTLQWLQQGLTTTVSPRPKRGLFGQFLTSVFGVNDEVYRDIDDLSSNQKELIKAANHQTKVMVSTVSTMNDTEVKINNQLERFRRKLNEGLTAVNGMSKWYNRIDTNKLNIHILSSYQLAANLIADEISTYSKLTNIEYGKGSLYDIISPAKVADIIISANKKLPQHLTILATPLLQTTYELSETTFFTNGHFLIIDVTEYEIMRITPTPLKITNHHYWTLKTSTNIIAVDYNAQTYFELTEEEFQKCMKITEHQLVCNPSVIKKIDTNPHCLIDYIYDRLEDTAKCPLKKLPLRSIIWKQLQMRNTWMFVVGRPTKIAIICDGDREDVTINSTGIIQITQNCLINTNRNVLAPKRMDTSPAINSYSKPVNITILPANVEKAHNIQLEPVLKLQESLSNIATEEEEIQEQLEEHPWKNIHHHPVAIGLGTAIIVAILCATTWCIVRRCLRPKRGIDSQMIELKPLRPSHPPL